MTTFTFTATATNAKTGQAGSLSASFTVVSTAQRIIVPPYNWGMSWQPIDAAAPYVSHVILNPNSGPGTSVDGTLLAKAQGARAAGIRVIGYIHTSYTGASLVSMKAQIDDYYNWYAVDGIFVDEVTNDPGAHQSYYVTLFDYIKSKPSGGRTVVINPGTMCDESYMLACDIACVFEGPWTSYQSFVPAAWNANYPADRFFHIVGGVTSLSLLSSASEATLKNRAGYIYITDDISYQTLAGDATGGGYWAQEVNWAATGG